jgi:hypothetical protein
VERSEIRNPDWRSSLKSSILIGGAVGKPHYDWRDNVSGQTNPAAGRFLVLINYINGFFFFSNTYKRGLAARIVFSNQD